MRLKIYFFKTKIQMSCAFKRAKNLVCPYNDMSWLNADFSLLSICSILIEFTVHSVIVCVCGLSCEEADGSEAAASSHYHAAILLEDHIWAVIKVEHRDGVELCRRAAGFGNRFRINKMNLGGRIGDKWWHVLDGIISFFMINALENLGVQWLCLILAKKVIR